jgi:hypothetical protein
VVRLKEKLLKIAARKVATAKITILGCLLRLTQPLSSPSVLSLLGCKTTLKEHEKRMMRMAQPKFNAAILSLLAAWNLQKSR